MGLKITIGCFGRASDIDPFVGLALALRDRGHVVRIAGSDDGAASIESWGFPFTALCDNLQAFLDSESVVRAVGRGDSAALHDLAARYAHAIRHSLRSGLIRACADADMILMPAILVAEASTLADLLHKPVAIVATAPALPPSWHVAQPYIARKPLLLPILTRLTHAIYDRRISGGLRRRDDNEWRTLLGIPRARSGFIREAVRRPLPQLHVYSKHLFGRPPDWPDFVETVGRITTTPARKFADGRGWLGQELVGWLDAGPPPVAIAFAHAAFGDSAAHLRVAQRLTQTLGVRVVVSSLRATADSTPDRVNVFVAAGADHDGLFPRCRAVVHHGDAGTTATAARAGIPAVVCSVIGTQRMWGQRVHDLGIGEHLAMRELDALRIGAALKRLDRSAVRQRARDIGCRISAEDGVPAAVATIERLYHQHDDRTRRTGSPRDGAGAGTPS